MQVWHPLAREMQPFIGQRIQVPAGSDTLQDGATGDEALRLRPESTVPANWDAY